MFMKKYALILIFLLLLSCSERKFGKIIEIDKFTPLLQIKKYPDNYLNKLVKIQGEIIEASDYNFWATIQDDFIIMTVILENFKGLPSLLDKKVIIIGKLINSRDGYVIKPRYLEIL